MANDDFILQFYKNIANAYGASSRSTMQDEFIRSVETNFICEEIQDFIQTHEVPARILDLGCGNGHLLEVIRKRFPNTTLFGLEFTPELMHLAKQRNLSRTHIGHGDMRLLKDYPSDKFDIIITERSLINLGSWKEQQLALYNISQKMNFPGRLISVESYEEPLLELNLARKEMGLEAIAVSDQNIYLKEKTTRRELEELGFFSRLTKTSANALSTHFYQARVLHPTIRGQGSKVKFTRMVNFFDESSVQGVGNYSPILLKSFEKKLPTH